MSVTVVQACEMLFNLACRLIIALAVKKKHAHVILCHNLAPWAHFCPDPPLEVGAVTKEINCTQFSVFDLTS